MKGRPGGANENAPMIAALDRPYPQIVAGTPNDWSFDPGTRVLTLAYSTTLPNGRAAGGLASDVWIPPLQYARGYRVIAAGARVISAPGACGLLLVAAPGATHVSVTVSPTPGGNATACKP